MRLILRLSLALLALAWATAALAGPPTRFLESQVQAVRDLLKVPVAKGKELEADAKLLAIVDPLMEFDALSERALQKHWPTLKPEQRAEFSSVFRELVFRSYLKKVRAANEEYTLVYEDEEAKGRKAANVTVIAKTKKADVELVFHLVAVEGRRFVAEDVIIDEVSLVANYREQFNKIIANEGFDALIARMKKKVAEFGQAPLPPVAGKAPPPPTTPVSAPK
jgi:phospholipid transport system substrate-binding protein